MPNTDPAPIIAYGSDASSAGQGALLSYNVPLPGSHSGRRIIELDLRALGGEPAPREDGERPATVSLPKTSITHADIRESAVGIWERWGKPSDRSIDAWNTGRRVLREQATEDWLRLARRGGISEQHLSQFRDCLANPEDPDLRRKFTNNSESAVYPLFSLFNQYQDALETGSPLKIPIRGGGGKIVPTSYVPPAPAPTCKFFLVEKWCVSTFLGNYGLGRTVKTLTLLPGEEMKIRIRTWQATKESRSDGSSIVDSQEAATAQKFCEDLQKQTTDKSAREDTQSWHLDAEVKAGWGWGSASISGGASGSAKSSSEQFAQDVMNTVAENARTASNSRQNTVSSSSEQSQSTENETVTERTIKNVNMRRTLNFVFRELNQEYRTKVHLADVRIGYSGKGVNWREVPLSGLKKLLQEVVAEKSVRSLFKAIVAHIANGTFDVHDEYAALVEKATIIKGSAKVETTDVAYGAEIEFPESDEFYYRIKRGPINQDGSSPAVDGVLMKEERIVLRTDSMLVEALLGNADALDSYASQMQLATALEKSAQANRIITENAQKELVNDLLEQLRDAPGIAVDQKVAACARLRGANDKVGPSATNG